MDPQYDMRCPVVDASKKKVNDLFKEHGHLLDEARAMRNKDAKLTKGGEGSTSDILKKAREEAYKIDLSFLEPKKKLTFDYNVAAKRVINDHLADLDQCLDDMKDLVDNRVKNFEEAFMSRYYGIEYELRK